MEHMHLVVNLSGESSGTNANNTLNSAIGDTGIILKLNKALLISKRQNLFFNEEYYKYAIEIKVNGEYWVIFRRYSEIREEHDRGCRKNPLLKKEPFPNRSPFNKTDSFQIERQQKLETYLKNYIQIMFGSEIYNYSATYKPANATNVVQPAMKLTKEVFCDLFSFFNETVEDKLNVQKLNWKSNQDSF